MARRTIDDLLTDARSRIVRLGPEEAYEALRRGALLVDLRSDTTRERDGIVPGSLHIPRLVLEWRLDPASEWRNPYVPGPDTEIVLMCDHGYSSSLAAATLRELGFSRVGDLAGGFQSWREAGLPVAPAPPRDPHALAGMDGPQGVLPG